jgi:hypothetical protein
MPSNRTYDDITCGNPACGKNFAPHDRRQVYCSRQCGINFNNDKKHALNQERYFREKQMRDCDEKLEILMESGFYKDDQIVETVLDAFAIDQTIGSLEENLDTARPIRWYHTYGIELVDDSKKLYTIHLRTNEQFIK